MNTPIVAQETEPCMLNTFTRTVYNMIDSTLSDIASIHI